jgi:hypothetical protein
VVCGDACIDPRSDVNNCGGCQKVCPAVPGGVATCSNNQCGVSCAAGSAACKGQCVDVDTDPKNCGSCGKTCPGKKTCTQGECS